MCPRECAPFVAEQLRREERLGNGGGIDLAEERGVPHLHDRRTFLVGETRPQDGDLLAFACTGNGDSERSCEISEELDLGLGKRSGPAPAEHRQPDQDVYDKGGQRDVRLCAAGGEGELVLVPCGLREEIRAGDWLSCA